MLHVMPGLLTGPPVLPAQPTDHENLLRYQERFVIFNTIKVNKPVSISVNPNQLFHLALNFSLGNF